MCLFTEHVKETLGEVDEYLQHVHRNSGLSNTLLEITTQWLCAYKARALVCNGGFDRFIVLAFCVIFVVTKIDYILYCYSY